MTLSPALDYESREPKPKGFIRFIPHVVRILMGLLFIVTGLNGFLNFLPAPSGPVSEEVGALMAGFMKSRYMFPMIMGTQLLAGLLLVIGRFVPLALVLIAPVIANIVAFHLFLDRKGLPVALVVLVLELYLIWAYRKAYRPMLAARVIPDPI